MTTRRTPKPSTVAKLSALAIRLEVNVLRDGRSYVTVLDMTRGQGVPITAVPEQHAGEAGDALVRALSTTPGILPPGLFGDDGPALMAMTTGGRDNLATVTVGSKRATAEQTLAAADRMIEALKNLRINIASDIAKQEVEKGRRKSLN